MCCHRELKCNTDVAKAYVRSEGHFCQALYAADVTHSQLLSRAATCYAPTIEDTLQDQNSTPRFLLTRTFSPRYVPSEYPGSLVPQSPQPEEANSRVPAEAETPPETRCVIRRMCYENSPSLASSWWSDVKDTCDRSHRPWRAAASLTRCKLNAAPGAKSHRYHSHPCEAS